MKLMRLSPVSQRLRRLARANAVGETSQAEYRQARRQLLAEVVPMPARKVDDTHRRGQVADITQRTSEPARHASKATKPLTNPEPARLRVKRIRHRWMIGALGFLVAGLWALLHA
jgi:hypothetical protein